VPKLQQLAFDAQAVYLDGKPVTRFKLALPPIRSTFMIGNNIR
jgi:hypothetical protein